MDFFTRERIKRNPEIANGFLCQATDMLDWPYLGAMISHSRSGFGPIGYDEGVMLRVVLLGQMRELSDRDLERQLHTNIEYMYFCDMATTDRVPDYSTICRFRRELAKRGLLRPLLDEVNRQLEEANLKPGPGRDSIIDATSMESAGSPVPRRPKDKPAAKPKKASNKQKQKGKSEADAKAAKGNSGGKARTASAPSAVYTDPDATWAKKGGDWWRGYKLFARVDGFGFFERLSVLTGKSAEGPHLEAMVEGCASDWVLADKAYCSAKNRNKLAELGIKSGIMHRAARNRPLTEEQKSFNKEISSRRWPVERSFGTLKRQFGGGRARYMTMQNVEAEMHLKAIGMNLLKAFNMSRMQTA